MSKKIQRVFRDRRLTAAIPMNVVVEFVREAEEMGLIPKKESLAA